MLGSQNKLLKVCLPNNRHRWLIFIGKKERKLKHQEEMNSPSKTLIKLMMYNPDTKSYSSSCTRTELSASISPMKSPK